MLPQAHRLHSFRRSALRVTLPITLIGAVTAQGQQPPAPTSAGPNEKATYLLSNERWHDGRDVIAPGTVNGLRGFEQFYEPIGQPLYFESPFNDTQLRPLFLHHEFANGSQLQGGDVDVYAAQARLALTERLAFIATEDGYSDIDTGILGSESGWNDLAFGFKYVAVADRAAGFVLTPGIRYMARNGDRDVLQGGVDEFSPFISAGKDFDGLHAIGNVTWRIPTDGDDGNQVLHWDIHVDFELARGVAPVVEVHGVHYLTNGNALPLSVGGLDYSNLGSANVSGSEVVWLELGGRVKFNPHVAVGAVYGFALTDPEDDIMDTRVTADLILSW